MVDTRAISLDPPAANLGDPWARIPLLLAAVLAPAFGLAAAGLLIAFQVHDPSALVAAGLASAVAAILFAAAVQRSLQARLRRIDATPAPTWVLLSLAPLTAVFGWLLSLAFAAGRPDGLALAVVAFVGMDVALLAAVILAWWIHRFHKESSARFPAEFQIESVSRTELPMPVRTYFDERSLILESMRFRKVEDFGRGKPPIQFSRVFSSENRETLAELACVLTSQGDDGVYASSFFSLFEDGSFLETTDLPVSSPLDDAVARLRCFPNADLPSLLNRHRRFAQEIVESHHIRILPIPPDRCLSVLTFAADQARRAGRRTASERE